MERVTILRVLGILFAAYMLVLVGLLFMNYTVWTGSLDYLRSESTDYMTLIFYLSFAVPIIQVFWKVKSKWRRVFSWVLLSISTLFMLFPGSLSALFIISLERWPTRGFIFSYGLVRYFNNASTIEVVLYQCCAAFFMLSLISLFVPKTTDTYSRTSTD